jgi:hypothetical protein
MKVSVTFLSLLKLWKLDNEAKFIGKLASPFSLFSIQGCDRTCSALSRYWDFESILVIRSFAESETLLNSGTKNYFPQNISDYSQKKSCPS